MEGLIQIARFLAFGGVVFLPGGWMTFGIPLRELSFSIRLLTGAVLAPLVVYFQFYIIRLLGVSFEVSAILLFILNLPVIYLISAGLAKFSIPDRRVTVLSMLVLIVVIASLVPQFSNTQMRAYSGHAWMHTDTIYMIANGELIPEDSQLAGVRLAYPWMGHIYQAILSYLLNSAPVSSYIWTNLLWLIFIAGFASAVVAELGGKQLARAVSVIWLLFGINFVGYIVGVDGDIRFIPWMLTFLFFSQMPFALGMFIALIFFLIRSEPAGVSASSLAVMLSLASGIGLIYPILFPPVAAVLGARLIAGFFESRRLPRRAFHREICLLGIVLVVASLVTFAHLKMVTHERVGEMILLTPVRYLIRKGIKSVVVTLPFLIGFVFVSRSCWNERPRAIIVLALGAIVSCLLYAIVEIPNWSNEYKFMLTAGVCLAPFPSLALESLMGRPEHALRVMIATILVLAAPFVHKIQSNTLIWLPNDRPVVNTLSFDLRLGDEDSLSQLCDVIRQKSPINSILVLDHEDYHFPTLTRRTLYVPPSPTQSHPGVNIVNDSLLTGVKGYDSRIVNERRSTLRQLFDSGSGLARVQSLKRILEFNRPVGIVLENRQHASLLKWLGRSGIGRSLYRGNQMTLWLVEPNDL